MEINFLTINRSPKPNYLDTTLSSLRASDWRHTRIPVNLMIGSDDESHVQEEAGIHIVPWVGERTEIGANFTRNYVRALRFRPEQDVVICEDDVQFTRNWIARLFFAIGEIPFEKYALSLYSANDLSDAAFDRGTWYRSYYAPSFYGTQGVYYPASVRLEIADYIERHIGREPGDLLIKEWVHNNNCLYLTQGSILEHIGRCSTGLGWFHSAWNLQQ